MTVRELRADEVGRLVDGLWLPFAREMAELDDFDALEDEATVREQAVEYRRGRIEDDDVRTCVAVDDDTGELLGYAEGEVRASPPIFDRGDECYVHGVYVVPGHRGRGLASALLSRIEEWGDGRHCDHVTLDVHPENGAARRMYDERGYEQKRTKLALAL